MWMLIAFFADRHSFSSSGSPIKIVSRHSPIDISADTFIPTILQEPLKQLIHLRQPCARVAISKPRPEHWNSHI
ncbi:uncharacterized protein LAJ45_05638 [Morchella importuna]|uniref:uncharacterized protein n=1 Tax=Morchella importuna TaxID=1174673 RepID=UPI001E8CBFD6|nr:uncharacterized protein LAJ45_05638 [Morchella importuna]KAH8150426.1 hypothetical protein LAJ45_05638 [Morchella importuna]